MISFDPYSINTDLLLSSFKILLYGQLRHWKRIGETPPRFYWLVVILETAISPVSTLIVAVHPGWGLNYFDVVISCAIEAAFCIAGWFLASIAPWYGKISSKIVGEVNRWVKSGGRA
jgi:hypothetical protein